MLEHSLKNYVDNRVLGGMVGLLRPGRGYAAWGGVPGLGQIRGLAPPQRGFKRAKDPNAADARVPPFPGVLLFGGGREGSGFGWGCREVAPAWHAADLSGEGEASEDVADFADFDVGAVGGDMVGEAIGKTPSALSAASAFKASTIGVWLRSVAAGGVGRARPGRGAGAGGPSRLMRMASRSAMRPCW